MNEQEIRERREKIRVIITEVFMFFSAIALVVFLTLIVMGYNFSLKRIGTEEEVIQRSGLVQVASRPTGAAILIDGNATLLLRTNGSRTAAAGEHEISLSREGYSGWKKNVEITEGLMYRLNYPRLFSLERREEEVFSFLEMPEFYTVSADGRSLVFLENGALKSVSLNEQKLAEKVLVEKTEFTEISKWVWSGNGERAVVLADGAWWLVNLRGMASISPLKEYVSSGAREIRFESEAGDKILYLDENGGLFEFNTAGTVVTRVVKEKVEKFANLQDKIFYLNEKGEAKIVRVGETEGRVLGVVEGEGVQIAVTEYYKDIYFGILSSGEFRVVKSTGWPETEESETWEIAREEEVEGRLEVRGGGMVFVIDSEREKRVFDIESGRMEEFRIEGANGWVDEFLRFEVRGGEIWVVDYDGNNWFQILSEEISRKSEMTEVESESDEDEVEEGAGENVLDEFVKISANNKYIYYIKGKKIYRQRV